jgi:hypothetical protein
MGRKKQQQPQANVGRVEDRPEEPADTDQVHENPDFDLDEWEEQNALQARPHKRCRDSEAKEKKSYITTSTGATATVHTVATAESQEWAFSELEIAINGEDAATVAKNATSLRDAQELSISQEGATLLLWPTDNAEIPWGYISMPSEELATHLKTCLASTLALGPLYQAPPHLSVENIEHLDDAAGPSTSRVSALVKSFKCPIGIRPAALQKFSAGWAEDSRRGSVPLLQIFRCLVPFNGINSASLDPELDFPEENEEIVPYSPLCSPASKFGAATAGVSSPHRPAAGADVGGSTATAAAAVSFAASEIYAAVKPTGQEPELTTELPQLRPTSQLRGYQRRAAQWMINRERFGDGQGGDGRLHPLWREVPCLSSFSSEQAESSEQQQDISDKEFGTTRRNKKQKTSISKKTKSLPQPPPPPATPTPEKQQKSFYVNIYTGILSLEPFPALTGPKGGIASDEMGKSTFLN